jgi:hypothetical protein
LDDTNDPSIGEPVLTTTAYNKRLDKASQIIRNVQRKPDVIGVEEMENLTVLQAVAAKVNSDVGNRRRSIIRLTWSKATTLAELMSAFS